MMEDILYAIDEILASAIDWLPNSPFASYLQVSTDSDINMLLSWLNYFIDIPAMITISELWLVSVAGYYIVSAILRTAKAVQ